MIDALTKVASLNALEKKLLTCKHPKLFLIDIKTFKYINLEHGDEGGNFVLCALAQSLLTFALNNEMSLFRAKNDQFILLLDSPFELAKMEKIIFALCDLLKEQRYTYQSNPILLSFHMGVSFDHTKALEKAYKALLVAKAENQLFVTYSEFANTLMEESEEKIEKMVKEAIENEHIVLHFQAVVDRIRHVAYYESLIRLESHQGLQSPKLFLKIAREKNFYDLLLENITKKITELINHQPSCIALNLSSFDLFDAKRVAFLCEQLANEKVIFEIQCDDSEHISQIIAIAQRLKKMGARIALDNVSHVSLLEAFENESIDFVKVHGDIIRNLAIDASAMLTCKAILEVCRTKNIHCIATNINAPTTLEVAQRLPFDFFQGYIFEQPHAM